MVVTPYKWTVEKWHELVDSGVLDGQRVELLEQEIVQMSPEGIEHSYTSQNVVVYLRNLLSGLACVRESHPVTLDNSEPEPDIAIVRLPETIYRQHHPYPEDIYWLVEISQKTLKKDLEAKSTIYARNGIPEYWVIDWQNNRVIVHTQLQDSQYLEMLTYQSGVISPLAFPNIEVAVNKLLLF